MALWYYGTQDGQKGPVEEEELKRLISAGTVTGATLVWTDGMQNWQAVQYVPGLGKYSVSPYLPGNSTLTDQVTYYQAAQTNGLAIASMVCGFLIFATCVTGIPAIICGHMALSQIKAAPLSVGGRGMALTGLVLGYLSLLPIVAIAALFFLGFLSSFSHP